MKLMLEQEIEEDSLNRWYGLHNIRYVDNQVTILGLITFL